MAESFSRQKSRHAPQKEGGLKILCDLPYPAGTSNALDVQNGWEENTHTQHRVLYLHCVFCLGMNQYQWLLLRELKLLTRRHEGT